MSRSRSPCSPCRCRAGSQTWWQQGSGEGHIRTMVGMTRSVCARAGEGHGWVSHPWVFRVFMHHSHIIRRLPYCIRVGKGCWHSPPYYEVLPAQCLSLAHDAEVLAGEDSHFYNAMLVQALSGFLVRGRNRQTPALYPPVPARLGSCQAGLPTHLALDLTNTLPLSGPCAPLPFSAPTVWPSLLKPAL